ALREGRFVSCQGVPYRFSVPLQSRLGAIHAMKRLRRRNRRNGKILRRRISLHGPCNETARSRPSGRRAHDPGWLRHCRLARPGGQAPERRVERTEGEVVGRRTFALVVSGDRPRATGESVSGLDPPVVPGGEPTVTVYGGA